MNYKYAATILTFALLGACASNPNSPIALECERGLNSAYKELDFARAKGFSGTIAYTKAASLLSAAKIQYEFEAYPNCIEKVARAREFIIRSQR